MPTRPSLPGVYLQEAPASPPAIAALPTAVTAFVGHTPDGPVHQPLAVRSGLDFERLFGGLAPGSTLGPAVQQFFDNGGTEALVVRLPPGAKGITAWLPTAQAARARRQGIYALDAVDHFNLLCLPPPSRSKDFSPAAWARAATYCQQRRALLLVDAPGHWTSVADALNGMDELQAAVAPTALANAAAYFPRLHAAPPAAGKIPISFAPCAAVAGLMARTDAHRGVWKAPAGSEATLSGMVGTSLAPTEAQLAELAGVGLNAVRSLPGRGLLVWGARTLAGHNALASEWKYVPVRRLALHIEQSVLRGTQWVVFEPNDAPLWARLRASVTHFLTTIWRQGGLMGQKPEEAFFVRCDGSTTTAADIAAHRLHLHIGIAPLKPAEFVLLRLTLQTAA